MLYCVHQNCSFKFPYLWSLQTDHLNLAITIRGWFNGGCCIKLSRISEICLLPCFNALLATRSCIDIRRFQDFNPSCGGRQIWPKQCAFCLRELVIYISLDGQRQIEKSFPTQFASFSLSFKCHPACNPETQDSQIQTPMQFNSWTCN